MTFVADTINLREIVMKEPLPLATIQNAVIEFLKGRDDAVLFGAQAVNVFVDEPRATQGVDVMSTRAKELAEALRAHLADLFHVAVRIRSIKSGAGYRVFQARKAGPRHLVDIRAVEAFPKVRRLAGIRVLAPHELIASKVVSYRHRLGKPKSGTDWRDLASLLLAFPELKRDPGPVTDSLRAARADRRVLEVWRRLVATEIVAPERDDDF